jgi:uncharacterized protein
MIAALAKAAQALEEPAYAAAAERALAFLEARLVSDEGRLLARYRDGDAAHPAYLDDYAFLCWGLLELYEAAFAAKHLDAAVKLCGEMTRLFWDEAGGGFYFTGEDGEPLLARAKEVYDGATPSGNSVAAMVLLRLARITGDPSLEKRADDLMLAFSGIVERYPSAHTQLLGALDLALGPAGEIVIAGEPASEEARAMVHAVRRRFLPRQVLLMNSPGEARVLHAVAPALRAQAPVGGRATAYLCENFACKAPVTDAGSLEALLDAPTGGAASSR